MNEIEESYKIRDQHIKFIIRDHYGYTIKRKRFWRSINEKARELFIFSMVLQQVLNKIMAGVFDDSPTFLKACYGKPLVIYFLWLEW